MVKTAEDVAREVVAAGVADACAAGWARFDVAQGLWLVATGGAFRAGGAGLPQDSTIAAVDTLFDLASVTKPMFAVALARSGFEHRRPLQEVLVEAKGSPSESVPIETLLAHRAGLAANLPMFQWLRDGATRTHVLREAAQARRAECRGPVPADGFDALYSDLGYVLAGEGVARALGAVDAGAIIDRHVVESLGLGDVLGTARSLSERGIDVTARAAPTEVVDWRGGAVRGAVHDENAWLLTERGGSGHAGMFGTVAGVLAFGRWVVSHMSEVEWTWRVRPHGTLRAGFDGKSVEGSSAGPVLGPNAFGHLGFTGTSLWIDPDQKVVVALLTNRVHPTRDSIAIRSARPTAHDALARLALGAELL